MGGDERARPYLPDRIRNSFAWDIGRRAVDGLKHGWKFFLRIEIGGRRDADRSNDCGSQVGKYVAEEIGPHDHVEPIRMTHEVSRQDIDMILVRADIGIAAGHRMKTFIPEWHCVNDAVRFCC